MKRYRWNIKKFTRNMFTALTAAFVIGSFGWMIINIPFYMTTGRL